MKVVDMYSTSELPAGYTEDWNDKIWNIGFLFKWSSHYKRWVSIGDTISIPPQTTLQDAYFKKYGEYMPTSYADGNTPENIFFIG